MNNGAIDRAILARAVLQRVPPLMQAALVKDPSFGPKFGLKADPVLELGASGLAVLRSTLYDAVRKISEGTSELSISDYEGNEQKIFAEAGEDGAVKHIVSYNNQRIILPDLDVLSADSSCRLLSFQKLSVDVNLPEESQETWRKILAERSLEDEEVDDLFADSRDTPIHLARSISREMREGKSSVSSLVPCSRRYYDRLVGAYDGSASINQYAEQVGEQFIAGLIAGRPYEGFLAGLLLSSHSVLASRIVIESMKSDDLVRAFEYLDTKGDRLSQLGAIEVGLRVLNARPELQPYILRLIENIRDDDVENSYEGLKLLSVLFILVDGELSRTRLMASEPPFYRRLASLAHAGLIHRQLVNTGAGEKFHEWAFNNSFERFYWQSLADMRLEPRWHPDLVSESQIKADFFGRIMIAANQFADNIEGNEVHALILGAEPNSIISLSKFPYPYLPGPLEGAEDCQNELPDDISEAIKEQLIAEEVGPKSFIALVNSALVFRIDQDQVESAADALKSANYQLSSVEDKSQLLSILNGLAIVVASSRSSALADELRILVRRYRSDSQYRLSIEEAVRMCLIAATSREELDEWREFVGEWITELAFSELENDEGEMLYSHLRCLLHAVPELWVSCARADAALSAYCSR